MAHRAGQSTTSSHILINHTPNGNSSLPASFQTAQPFSAHCQFQPPNDQQEIIRLLMVLNEGQARISVRLDQLESKIDDLQKEVPRKLGKVHVELEKISTRTGYIKEVSMNAAAHTLNTSRKIHGAKSVLDPVKHFRKDYKNWSIQPEPAAASFIPFPTQTMFPQGHPFNPFGTYGAITEPRTPVDHEDLGYSSGTRTPVYGTRTPVYESNFPEISSSSSHYIHNRYEPYKNRNNHNQSNVNPARRTSSPYVPTSPQFCD